MIAGLLLTLVKSLPVVIVGLAIFPREFSCASCSHGADGCDRRTRAIVGRRLYVTFYYLGGSVGATLTDFFWRWKSCSAACFVRWSFAGELVAGADQQPSTRPAGFGGDRSVAIESQNPDFWPGIISWLARHPPMVFAIQRCVTVGFHPMRQVGRRLHPIVWPVHINRCICGHPKTNRCRSVFDVSGTTAGYRADMCLRSCRPTIRKEWLVAGSNS